MHRHTESFATHTWMLKMLLRRLKDNPQSEPDMIAFLSYVIAVSSEKMNYRITNGPSPLYFACLVKLIKASFDFKEHPDIPSRSNRDQIFLDAIPFLAEFTTTKIPNLQKMAQLVAKNKPLDIYNKDTYMEFHKLLCELLMRFRGSLDELVDLKTEDEVEIHNALTSVRITGDFLWTMVRTAAIKKHLKTIDHLLDFDQGGVVPDQERHSHEGDGQKQDGQVQDGQAREGQARDGQVRDCEEDEGDTDFDLLKPYNTSKGKPLLP